MTAVRKRVQKAGRGIKIPEERGEREEREEREERSSRKVENNPRHQTNHPHSRKKRAPRRSLEYFILAYQEA